MSNKPILALPTLLKSLDVQIKDAGGKGFNCEVESTRLQGSFAVQHRFDTEDGPKILQTPNHLRLARVEAAGHMHYIVYYGDTGEFVLVRPFVVKKENKTILLVNHLGFCFESTGKSLEKIFPDIENFKLDDPDDILKKRAVNQNHS